MRDSSPGRSEGRAERGRTRLSVVPTHAERRLPSYATPFVGRRDLLETLAGGVRSGVRLQTLVGPAGVGKTRLAAEVGRRLAAELGERVLYCDLAATATADDVASALVLACSASGAPSGEDPIELCGRWLAGRGPVLLLLDDLERIVEVVGPTIERLLSLAPELRCVGTSRRALGVAAESIVAIEPMPLPDAEGPAAAISSADSVRLFLGAVLSAPLGPHRAWTPAPEDLPLIADIARRLDGLPLALELAAARLEVLTLPQLLERLSDRFAVLRDPMRPPGDRHRALDRAIEQSWELLGPAERRTLAQSSVFAGGFTLDAAEAVVELGADAGGATVLDCVHALVRHSLLRSVGSGSEPRFSMLESIRELGRAKLDPDERARAERRHAEHYLSRGRAWAAAVHGPSIVATLDTIETESSNLRAVFRRAIAEPPDEGSVRRALSAVLVLGRLLELRGPLPVLVRFLDEALAFAARLGQPTVEVAAAVRARGLALRYLGDVAAAERESSRARDLAVALGDREIEAWALGNLGNLQQVSGRYEEAFRSYDRAHELSAGRGDRLHCGRMKAARGLLLLEVGRFEEAERSFHEGLAILREVGDVAFIPFVLGHLGTLFSELGRLAEAAGHYEEARALFEQLGNARGAMTAGGGLALLAHLDSRLDDARAGYEETLEGAREARDVRYEGYFLAYIGLLELELGALDAGRSRLLAAEERLRSTADVRYQAIVAAALAGERALQGRAAEAESALAAAEASLARVADPTLAALADVVRALIELARAREDAEAADRLVASARARRAANAAIHSDDVRLAIRILDRALADAEARAAAWTVAPDGAWFRIPGGDRVDIAHRKACAGILRELARAHGAGEGPLGVEALAGAGWPGTRLVAASVANRVQVAISTLRSSGLKPILLRVKDGYLLDPAAAVRIAESAGGA